jgi:opacity protein-like surface antigen
MQKDVAGEGFWQRLPEGDHLHHDYLGGLLSAEVGLPLGGIRPYAIGGLGLVRHEERHDDHGHGAHTDFGINIGLGTNVGFMGLNAYVEARYHHLFNGDHDNGHGHGHGHDEHTGNTFLPIIFGIRF